MFHGDSNPEGLFSFRLFSISRSPFNLTLNASSMSLAPLWRGTGIPSGVSVVFKCSRTNCKVCISSSCARISIWPKTSHWCVSLSGSGCAWAMAQHLARFCHKRAWTTNRGWVSLEPYTSKITGIVAVLHTCSPQQNIIKSSLITFQRALGIPEFSAIFLAEDSTHTRCWPGLCQFGHVTVTAFVLASEGGVGTPGSEEIAQITEAQHLPKKRYLTLIHWAGPTRMIKNATGMYLRVVVSLFVTSSCSGWLNLWPIMASLRCCVHALAPIGTSCSLCLSLG